MAKQQLKSGVFLAEFIGTFSLAFAVLASINGSVPGVATAILAGFTLVLAVLSIGSISGAHINPAVTIGLWSIKKISSMNALGYIVVQVLGAAAAWGVMNLLLQGDAVGVKSAASSWPVFFAEMIGTLIFTFGVAAAVEQGFEKISAAVLVGGSLFLGIAFAAVVSNGVLNPAVAIGISSFTWAYVLGPIVGAVIGMNLQRYMRKMA